MLYPQSNEKRTTTSLNGIWGYKLVDDNYLPLTAAEGLRPMAVPASINDIVTDKNISGYVGKVLFERDFSLPIEKSREYRLRIGATSQKCEVFLNGKKIGAGLSGFYPIDLRLDDLKGKNRLTIIIDNRLDYHTLPPGRLEKYSTLYVTTSYGRQPVETSERADKWRQIINHDFYNFTGIHRDVIIYSLPQKPIRDITIKTVVGGDYSKITAEVDSESKITAYIVFDGEKEVVRTNNSNITIKNPVLWSCENPHLYTLRVESETDVYEQNFGIRKIFCDKNGVYLNDKPVYFKGFGMHEDFFVTGKANISAVNVRNFELLRWINANSIRTSHYPYAEEIMDLCDKYGILVIDEVPAVGLTGWPGYVFGEGRLDKKTQALHKELLRQLWERDKNHPSIVMMNVANEPAAYEEKSREYFAPLIAYAREISGLPITLTELANFAKDDYVGDLVDVLSLNRYYGWYDEIGDIQAIAPLMKNELKTYYDKYGKPILITEFGADTIEGNHSAQAEAFSEEYQREYYAENCRVFDESPFVIGEMAWVFADFKTKEGVLRVRGNRKGVFTKEREPKAAAYFFKSRWQEKKEK